MTVRNTSAQAYAQNSHESKKHRIRVFVREHSPCTRKQIAVGLGYDTATVSGLVAPLVRDGLLDEVGKGKCSVTGNNVMMIESPVKQMRLI